MFKNGVSLKKDAWYIKFMHFMWGATYEDFPNLCPLFWAVIGSITIFPFWCLWKVIAFVFSLGGNLTWKQVKTPLSWIAEGIWLWVMSVFVTLLIVSTLNSLLAKFFDGGSWHGYLQFLIMAGIFILVVIAGVFVIMGLVVYNSHAKSVKNRTITYNSTAAKFLDSWIVMLPYYVFSWILIPFKGILKGIVEFIKLIAGFFYYDIYKKNCPFITWEE